MIMICIILSPLFYNNLLREGYSSYKADSLKLDSLIQIMQHNLDSMVKASNTMKLTGDTVFPFNPNEVSYTQMISLGFDSIIARRIIKFRNSYGIFHEKKDLLRIYNLPESLYFRLEDHISLPESREKLKPEYGITNILMKDPVNHHVIEKAYLNINLADTNDLKTVKGIGSVLSARIIKYRDLLGGYSNIDQLDDVYGLYGSSLDNIKSVAFVDSLFIPERISINFSEWKDLAGHPYINSKMANDIINLRSAKGFLKGMDDLKEISYLNDSILERLLPYFDF
jgi:DNA uptake protein ComE-like DNA-binding protein